MTLLSNTILVHSSDNTNSNSIKESIGSSSSSWIQQGKDDILDGKTPSQLLAMAIRKKRKTLRSKDHDLRVEILLTSTIRHLCQEIGDRLRSKRLINNSMKRKLEMMDDTTVSKRKYFHDETVVIDEAVADSAHENFDQKLMETEDDLKSSSSDIELRKRKIEDNNSNSTKRSRSNINSSKSDDNNNNNNEDPFGLDDFFRSLRTCRVGGSKS